jgi:hypothetical protein
MKHTLRSALVILTCLAAQFAGAQQLPVTRMKDGVHIVATNEIVAELAVTNARERITGRVSFHLVTTSEDVEKGQILVRGFNIAFFGVSQELLAGGAPIDEPLGLLGFALIAGKPQSLRFDKEKNQIFGELQMFADASFLNKFAEPVQDAKGDQFETPVIPTTGTIRIDLEKPLPGVIDQPERIRTKLELKLHGKGLQSKEFVFPEFEITLSPIPVAIDLSQLLPFEVAQKLCVQPVRLLRFAWPLIQLSGAGLTLPLIQLSGAGLTFGEPGTSTEWRKGDIVFEIRDWKTLLAGDYWVLSSSEAGALRALVDDDDCIEVFFVYSFDPVDQWGGGATWGSGTASAKIISSDGNARGGVDFTHLAHELGHVLGLRHPDDAATASAQPASSGTLMCPSGYLNDNPHINSQENEDLLSNPLLVFAIKSRSPGPDCLNSADCGLCP